MRITPRCPGLWHGSLLHSINTNGHTKIIVSILGLLTVIIVGSIAVFELHASLQHRIETAQHDSHPLSRKKFSVVVGTDVNNPTLRYGVVIDCGSSGSRVYIYFWPPHNGNAKELLSIQHMRGSDGQQVLKKITPGLSAYADKPSEASDYLKPLLEYAAEFVPQHKHQETPLYILATAGLRMLPESQQVAIMDDLRVDIPMDFKFMFVGTHAEVISGKQEGVYAWIAINYVMGKFDHFVGDDAMSVVDVPGRDSTTHVRKRTIGIIDMGGGSTQIAYEVPQSVRFHSTKEDVAKSLLAEFNLGCTTSDIDHTYRVYVSTFLGFGGNAARRKYVKNLIDIAKTGVVTPQKNNTIKLPGKSEATALLDPCLPPSLKETVKNSGDTYWAGEKDFGKASGDTYHLEGTGNYEECQEKVAPLLNMTATCSKEPCSMNGMFQPSINFRNSEFYGFSEFYYTMEDILKMGGPYKYLKFLQAAKNYCHTDWLTLWAWFDKKLHPRADYNRYRYQCFKSAWITQVLHQGFHFPKVYKSFTSAQLVDGREVHWTLGALLYKTRYFPLSAIQQHTSHHPRPPWVVGQLQYSWHLIIACFIVVVMAIFIYLRRLRIVRRPDLRKVPSMAYFMTEEGQVEDGITVRNVFP